MPKRYGLDGLSIMVEYAGDGLAPWATQRDDLRSYAYRVTVRDDAGHEYVTMAWGSASDYVAGRHDPEGIAGMVADELYLAANDPQEFFELAGTEPGGAWTVARARRILAIIETGEAMLPALERNADTIRRMADGDDDEPRYCANGCGYRLPDEYGPTETVCGACLDAGEGE